MLNSVSQRAQKFSRKGGTYTFMISLTANFWKSFLKITFKKVCLYARKEFLNKK